MKRTNVPVHVIHEVDGMEIKLSIFPNDALVIADWSKAYARKMLGQNGPAIQDGLRELIKELGDRLLETGELL